MMGMESVVGKGLSVIGSTEEGTIIGVVKNAHFKSLHHPIHPQIFYVFSDFTSARLDLYGIVLINIRGNIPETISAIEDVWKGVNPNTPFEYHFLNEIIDKQYDSEQRISKVVNYFTFLAIFVSCIGLFGLSAYMAEQRTKEIGIRKVLGASVSAILGLLSKDFLKLVLMAILVAWPISYVAMRLWLQEFAYRIDVGIATLLLAGIAALLIALLTISFQAIRAATANPVETLRYE